MAWITSTLYADLEDNATTKKIIDGMTFVGDNAYTKKRYMSIPFRGMQGNYEDAYNFYQSQLRITIERAFGVLFHRWSNLRAPLVVPHQKVSPLIESLVHLHNFCIDENTDTSSEAIEDVEDNNIAHLKRNIHVSSLLFDSGDQNIVDLDSAGRPTSLLDYGHHFIDDPRRYVLCWMKHQWMLCLD